MAETAVAEIALYLSEGELILTATETAYIVAAIEIVAPAVSERQLLRCGTNGGMASLP